MKTKLLTICLLIFTSQVSANCYNNIDVDVEWYQINKTYKFNFKSKTNRPILISSIRVIAKDKNKTAITLNRKEYLLGAYKILGVGLSVSDVNIEYIGGTKWDCRYAG